MRGVVGQVKMREEIAQEIEVLQAIYGEKCFKLREGAWGVHGPPSFSIKIEPLELYKEKEIYTSITCNFYVGTVLVDISIKHYF